MSLLHGVVRSSGLLGGRRHPVRCYSTNCRAQPTQGLPSYSQHFALSPFKISGKWGIWRLPLFSLHEVYSNRYATLTMAWSHCHQWHLNLVRPLSCETQVPTAPMFMKVFHNWRRQWKIKQLSVSQLYHLSAFVALNLLLRDAKSCLYLAHSEIHHSLQIFPLLSLWIFSPVYKSVLPRCCHC